MKYLKRFNEGLLSSFTLTMGAIALYNLFKANAKQGQLSGSSNDKVKFFDELSKLTTEYEKKDQLIGDIINTDDLTQIIFKYGGGDNVITIKANWNTSKLIIKWDFDTAIFPYIKAYSSDETEFVMDEDDRKKIKAIITEMGKR